MKNTNKQNDNEISFNQLGENAFKAWQLGFKEIGKGDANCIGALYLAFKDNHEYYAMSKELLEIAGNAEERVTVSNIQITLFNEVFGISPDDYKSIVSSNERTRLKKVLPVAVAAFDLNPKDCIIAKVKGNNVASIEISGSFVKPDDSDYSDKYLIISKDVSAAKLIGLARKALGKERQREPQTIQPRIAKFKLKEVVSYMENVIKGLEGYPAPDNDEMQRLTELSQALYIYVRDNSTPIKKAA